MQQQIIDKKIEFYAIDAYAIARATGMGTRINTIMQTGFFAISGVLPQDVAIEKIKYAAEKTYSKKGRSIVEANWKAIDETVANLHRVSVPAEASSSFEMPSHIPANAPEFVRLVSGEIMAGRGDLIPVSRMPADGTWPTGTSHYDKRNLALEIPVWDADLCIYCGKCPFVCPHIPRSAARSTRRNWRRTRRRPSSTSRSRGRNSSPAPTSPTKWPPRTAPAARCASTSARR